MSHEITTLEMIAPSVEEATANGLEQLGVAREAVEIEVLDAGSRGLFGLGSRQARVVLRLKTLAEISTKPAVTSAVKTRETGDGQALNVARQVVEELVQKMHVNAQVSARYIPSDDPKEQPTIMVDIQGDDLSILIGRRAETLGALQYITSLIIGRELGEWHPLLIDVQGYRSRRERQLRQLARRMADQAVHTGRKQVLEPMPAAERRVIHMELRNHPQVTTESVGDEPYRKVTILLQK
jgi:spoIIIJ-associated protein